MYGTVGFFGEGASNLAMPSRAHDCWRRLPRREGHGNRSMLPVPQDPRHGLLGVRCSDIGRPQSSQRSPALTNRR